MHLHRSLFRNSALVRGPVDARQAGPPGLCKAGLGLVGKELAPNPIHPHPYGVLARGFRGVTGAGGRVVRGYSRNSGFGVCRGLVLYGGFRYAGSGSMAYGTGAATIQEDGS